MDLSERKKRSRFHLFGEKTRQTNPFIQNSLNNDAKRKQSSITQYLNNQSFNGEPMLQSIQKNDYGSNLFRSNHMASTNNLNSSLGDSKSKHIDESIYSSPKVCSPFSADNSMRTSPFEKKPFSTLRSIRNTQQDVVMEELDLCEEDVRESAGSQYFNDNKMDSNPFSQNTPQTKVFKSGHIDNHRYFTSTEKKESGTLRRHPNKFNNVRLKSKINDEYHYYRVFNEKEIGFCNEGMIQDCIIDFKKDIDVETDDLDMENSFEIAQSDIKEGVTGYIFGFTPVLNMSKRRFKYNF